MKFIFLDTETTGLEKDTETSHGDEVIQIGGVLTDDSLRPLKVFDFLCDTTKPYINKGALAVHGITLEYLREKVRDVYLEEVIHTRLPELLSEKDLIVVGHNIMFDITMIQQTMRDCAKIPLFGGEVQPPTIPSEGRYYIDTIPYFMRKTPKGVFRQKLSVISKNYEKQFNDFLDNTSGELFATNYSRDTGAHMHDALTDAIYCYIIFKYGVWKTKLL